ncbi:olfactory receptor 10AD1-like [Apodemus sylvaticus]|uniref:olfactory receptor 10AD1-like n=1 Tax=Apodemus sylvaticus TaxID=10129 RepID=UPI002242FCCD|nr:olfactory receptor 10AD1-like [Apodemus sylvaticus]
MPTNWKAHQVPLSSRVAHQLSPSSLEQLFCKHHAISVSRNSDSVTQPEQQSHGMRLQTADPRNSSSVTEFILVGFEQSSPSTRALLFTLFLALYSLAMAMNGLIIFITWTDPRLHSPMYFFLGHLSFLDICFITTTIPQMLVHLVTKNHTVSFASCMTQMYLVFLVGVAECILLAFMAYDRYVAICHPLNYAQIMSQKVCVRLVCSSWTFGMVNGIFLEYMSFRNPFCKDNHIENFFCEAPIVIALSCGNPEFSMKLIFVDAIVVLLSPMVLIVTSYARILASILRRASSSGRGKTFSTCASHLTVVIFFYTSAMFSYMNPRSTHGPDKDKPFSLLYTIITPMCNPVIYSFRNKEMKGAMGRALGRGSLAQAESV